VWINEARKKNPKKNRKTNNELGWFEWNKTDYTLSALNIKLTGVELSADLTKSDGTVHTGAVIHLDDHIENKDGVLTYE